MVSAVIGAKPQSFRLARPSVQARPNEHAKQEGSAHFSAQIAQESNNFRLLQLAWQGAAGNPGEPD